MKIFEGRIKRKKLSVFKLFTIKLKKIVYKGKLVI